MGPSLLQKVIAYLVMMTMNVVIFVFRPLMGIIAFFIFLP